MKIVSFLLVSSFILASNSAKAQDISAVPGMFAGKGRSGCTDRACWQEAVNNAVNACKASGATSCSVPKTASDNCYFNNGYTCFSLNNSNKTSCTVDGLTVNLHSSGKLAWIESETLSSGVATHQDSTAKEIRQLVDQCFSDKFDEILALPYNAENGRGSAAATHFDGYNVVTFTGHKQLRTGPALHEIAHRWANRSIPAKCWEQSRGEYDCGNCNGGSCGHWGVSNAGGVLGGYKTLTTAYSCTLPSPYVKCVNGKCPIDGVDQCWPDTSGSVEYDIYNHTWMKNQGGVDYWAWRNGPYCHKNFSNKVVLKNNSGSVDVLTENGVKTVQLSDVCKSSTIGADYNHPNGGFLLAQSINNKPFSMLELCMMGLAKKDEVPPLEFWSGITSYNDQTGAFTATTKNTPDFQCAQRLPANHQFRMLALVVGANKPSDNDFAEFQKTVDIFSKKEKVTDDENLFKGQDGKIVYPEFNFWMATDKRASLKMDELKLK